jgi:hypothetical protein
MQNERPSRFLFCILHSAFCIGLLACVAAWLPYTRPLISPVIVGDDFEILAQSRTWGKTVDVLWVPQNEHVMPLGRLLTFALEQLPIPLSSVTAVVTFVGPVALLGAMLLVFVFVRRELGHPLYGLLALVLFGVNSVYHQTVYWFAASFAILALDTMLLGLLAAQRWRQTGRGVYLALTVLACLLAPGWFAIGVLAAPLCSLYLLLPSRGELCSWRARLPAALVPWVGTAGFLALSLPHAGHTIMHAGHYKGLTAVEAFRPLEGLHFTARSVVDNLLCGLGGFWLIQIPEPYVYVPLALAIYLAYRWWRPATDRRLMLLGLALIICSYWLIYSARATWGYKEMSDRVWTRYHLLPHLGLVLFFCGGLAQRGRRWFHLRADGALTTRQQRACLALIVVCLLIHLPRGYYCAETALCDQFPAREVQIEELGRIDAVDARCRQYHISADAARQVLPRFTLYWSVDVINGWDLLRGSDDPRPRPPEEVKRLLEAP